MFKFTLKHRRKFALAAGLILFAFLISMVVPVYGMICTQKEYMDKEDCSSYHIGFVVLWNIGKIVNDYSGLITGIATVLLAIITGLLVKLGRDQSDTTRAQLRAYLTFTSKLVLSESLLVESEFKLANTGQTPAYKVEDRSNLWLDTYPAPAQMRAPIVDADNKATVVGPNDHITLFGDVIELSQQELEAIQREELAIWAVVRVTYEDTFGRPWETFAVYYRTGDAFINPEERRMNINEFTAT